MKINGLNLASTEQEGPKSGSMNFDSDHFGGTTTTSSLRRPWVAFSHVFFRSSALVVYLLGTSLSFSFIGVFVSVVLLLSLDFWTVKNITGRIMVGLRWWNYINDSGESEWVFESRDGTEMPLDTLETPSSGKMDARLFWSGLIVAPLVWAIFFLTALFGFKFQWLVLVVIGFSLSMSNLLGYLRCRLGNKQSVGNMANAYMQKQMFSNMMNMFKAQQQQQPNDVI